MSVAKHCHSLGEHGIYYTIGSYTKNKWMDGSIHVGSYKRYFSKKFNAFNGLMDELLK